MVPANDILSTIATFLCATWELSMRDCWNITWKIRTHKTAGRLTCSMTGESVKPPAVEFAKLSLWLSTLAKDRPLSFLDHHLRTGNALIGARLASLTYARNGNGNGKNGNGHGKNGNGHGEAKEQLSLFDDDIFRQSMTTAVDLMWLVEDSPAQTVEQVKEQEQIHAPMR